MQVIPKWMIFLSELKDITKRVPAKSTSSGNIQKNCGETNKLKAI
jgi:hypothetical protein